MIKSLTHIILIIGLLVLTISSSMAQQPYFSSYQNTELSLNPGYTGIDNVMGFNVTH